MIDNDDNYYDASNERYFYIRDTGRYTPQAPVYMQKVQMPPTNENYIIAGYVGLRDKTGISNSIPFFYKRTKELEEGQRQALKRFTERYIAPKFMQYYPLHQMNKIDLENYIFEKKALRHKKIDKIQKEFLREIKKVEKEFDDLIAYAEKILTEMECKNENAE